MGDPSVSSGGQLGACQHVCMRTTIELTDDSHEAISALARRHGLRGLSEVQRSVDLYLGSLDAAATEVVLGLEGTVSETSAAATRESMRQIAVFSSGAGEAARLVEARFVPAPDDEALCIVRDITERHRAEQALAEQLAFEALVTAISTRLVGCAPGEIDEAIVTGLEEVATFFDADRASIDELTPEGSTLRLAHRWHRPGHDGPRRVGHRLEPAGSWWLASRFERSGSVVAGPGALPPEAVAASLVVDGDRGALWTPLGVGDGLVGVLGLTWRRRAPAFGEELLALARLAGDAFHGALLRRGVALLADGQARVFESIARGEPVALSLLGASALLAEHTPGARVVVLTLDHDRLAPVTNGTVHPWADWFGTLDLDLDNPYGQAVTTGEPVVVADAASDPRFGGRAVPDPAYRGVRVLPLRSSLDGRTLGLVVVLGEDLAVTVPHPEVRDSVLSLATVALEREHDARRLAHQATHDPLTGVANRAALLDRLQLVLARARRSGRHVGVLFCDLDGFKAVNDRYGHDRGDRLLVEVAARIAGAIRPSDTVSRTGGDEFVVVCEDLDAPGRAATIAAPGPRCGGHGARRPRRSIPRHCHQHRGCGGRPGPR
jgi:GGDEF domain-containing protein